MRFFAVLLLSVAVRAAYTQDLRDVNVGFQFIYHEYANLLLTIHGETCYFSAILGEAREQMYTERRILLEGVVANAVLNNDMSKLSISTLDAMRDTYADRLADWHCLDKTVYTLDLSTPLITATAETTTSATVLSTTTQSRTTTSGTHTPVSPCGAMDHTAIFSCCFENGEADRGWCNIRQGSHDDFDWTRHQGAALASNTGPSHDHSFGNLEGHYVYITSRSTAHHWGNTFASIVTQPFPAISSTVPYCLKFYYHMYGDNIGSLHVHVTHTSDSYSLVNQEGQLIFRRDGNQGNVWKEALIDFTTHGPFEIDFEGYLGHGQQGDIALDDILLYRGPCNEQLVATTSTVRLWGGQSHNF